jgi:hypothetical protein
MGAVRLGRQSVSELGPETRLWEGLATSLVPDRGELYTDELGERLLSVTHDFAALGQSPALNFHGPPRPRTQTRSRR